MWVLLLDVEIFQPGQEDAAAEFFVAVLPDECRIFSIALLSVGIAQGDAGGREFRRFLDNLLQGGNRLVFIVIGQLLAATS